MGQYLLSVCISSYNKGQRCIDLVNKIKSLNDPTIEIIICDDGSGEYHKALLSTIKYDRCKIYYNSDNLGACKNWYETLSKGEGEYLLHVLDRDYLDVDIIKDFMELVKEERIGIGCIGRGELLGEPDFYSNGFGIYNAGSATTVKVAGTLFHPTGFVISRDIWDKNRLFLKEYFYDEKKYGMYPHSYLIGFFSKDHKVICGTKLFYKYVYSMEAERSRFYSNSKSELWWTPQGVFANTTKLLSELVRKIDREYREQLLINVYKLSVSRATMGYSECLLNEKQMRHYGLQVKETSLMSLYGISISYSLKYIAFLMRLNVQSPSLFLHIFSMWMKNVKELILGY